MPKVVKDDWEFKVESMETGMCYHANYTVESDGIEERRCIEITFIPQEEAQTVNFINNVVRPKVEAEEA